MKQLSKAPPGHSEAAHSKEKQQASPSPASGKPATGWSTRRLLEMKLLLISPLLQQHPQYGK